MARRRIPPNRPIYGVAQKIVLQGGVRGFATTPPSDVGSGFVHYGVSRSKSVTAAADTIRRTTKLIAHAL